VGGKHFFTAPYARGRDRTSAQRSQEPYRASPPTQMGLDHARSPSICATRT
jgi:hypothetical protein